MNCLEQDLQSITIAKMEQISTSLSLHGLRISTISIGILGRSIIRRWAMSSKSLVFLESKPDAGIGYYLENSSDGLQDCSLASRLHSSNIVTGMHIG